MTKKADNTLPRLIPRGSCTWCGHQPHQAACPSTIRTAVAAESPCPCSRRTEGTA
jgi:hypothetical protein